MAIGDKTFLATKQSVIDIDLRVDDLELNKVDKVTGKGLSTNDYTDDEQDKLANIEALAEVNNISDANAAALVGGQSITQHYHNADRARANHTGTQSADTLVDGTINKAYTATEKTKLAGIATSATKVADSTTNGNILVNDVEVKVYDDTALVQQNIADKKTYSNAIKQVGVGTSVNFKDTLDVPLIDVKLEGASQQTVTVQGKNICPTNFGEWESGDYSATDGTKIVNANTIRLKRLVAVTPSTVYYVHTFDNDSSFTYLFSIRTYGADGLFKRSIGGVANGGTITLNVDEYYLGLRIYSTEGTAVYTSFQTSFTNATLLPLICLNTETDKNSATFVPNSPSPDYPAQITNAGDSAFDLVCSGKNWFDGVLEQGSITSSGGLTGDTLAVRTKNFISAASGKTYVRSNSLSQSNGRIAFYLNGTFVSAVTDVATFTVPTNANQIKYAIYHTSAITPSSIAWAQLEVGSVATTYEAYKSNKQTLTQLLPSLPNGVKNTIEKINGVWNYVQRVGKVILNGSETWTLMATQTNTLRFDVAILTGAASADTYRILSDKFKCMLSSDATDTEHIKNAVSPNQASLILYINKARLTTQDAAGFKAWLTSNNVTVLYELATPIYTPLSDIYLTSYPSITNVFTTASVQPRLTVTAVKDVNAQFPITNVLTNGDFNNGGNDWTALYSTISTLNNKLTNVASGSTNNGRITQTSKIAAVSGKKVYLKFVGKVTNSSCTSLQITVRGTTVQGTIQSVGQTPPVSGTTYNLSGIVTIPSDMTGNLMFDIIHYYADAATASGKVMEVQYISAIDLPETFGAGNEPTKAEMDELMAYFPNSWFDGTVNLAEYKWFMIYLMNKLRTKANIVQEAWITPTLLNGWVNFGVPFQNCQYIKDNMGVVHLKGMIKSGTVSVSIFTLPVGYRPKSALLIPVISNSVLGRLDIESNGNVTLNTGSNAYVSLDSITFLAEQ